MSLQNLNIKGLSNEQVLLARKKHGLNSLSYKKTNPYFQAVRNLVKEPMILLLLVAASIYFISGKTGDGIFLLSAILIVSVITLFQDSRSRNALEKLKDFTLPKAKVIRNGKTVEIDSKDIVLGDSLLIEEGTGIAADGTIIHSNDFSVNES
ncbi:MAG: cation-translocating P-type ATPase, partial [Flavobacterium sp.]|nr:cation-translocating P-type ATPase [Flavobacterium sp.]